MSGKMSVSCVKPEKLCYNEALQGGMPLELTNTSAEEILKGG